MSALLLMLPGDVSVMGTTTANGDQIFSVYQFINLVCERSGLFSSDEWKRMMRSKRLKTKVRGGPFDREFGMMRVPEYNPHRLQVPPTNRRVNSPAMTVTGLHRLLSLLRDKVDSDVCQLVGPLLERYMAGDKSMIEVA
jgi:hypothetical protein